MIPVRDRNGALVIGGFLLLVVILFAAAVYWLGMKPAPREGRVLAPTEENRLLDEIERASASLAWADVENARQAALRRLKSDNHAPGRGVALYFFPELLSEQSLESDISKEEIAPAMETLRTANGEAARTAAMEILRSRVENYELGATTEEEQLSPEAGRFLGIYEKLKR